MWHPGQQFGQTLAHGIDIAQNEERGRIRFAQRTIQCTQGIAAQHHTVAARFDLLHVLGW